MAANSTEKPGATQSPTPGQITTLTIPQRMNARRLFFRQELTKRQETFKELLPGQIPTAKFIGVILNACILNPQLLDCSPQSVLAAAMKCAQLGLMPDSYTGEAHLIPFKNNSKGGLLEAQFIPGYRGLVQLAMRTGQVKRFQARAVYKDDIFDYSLGTEEYIKHKPVAQSGEITHFYAIIEFTNGGLMFEVMTDAQVKEVRNNAPNYKYTKDDKKKDTIWEKHYAEMGKKTVIRNLSKYAPVSPEFQTAVSLSEQAEIIGEGQPITDDIEWEELTAEEQERLMHELLEQDKTKKEKIQATFIKNPNQSTRAANLQQQTEDLIKKKQ